MRTTHSKGNISIIIDYGDENHNPNEIKRIGAAYIPYINYEGV